MPEPVVQPLTIELPESLRRVLDSGPAFARAFVVGGSVRDALLGRPVKDVDVEVWGLRAGELAAALAPFGATDEVGRAFGVVRLPLGGNEWADFSLPRRDSRTGEGHRGFAIETDPELPMAEAAARRDFTLNALLWDPRRGEVLDHHGGLADLRARVLRHTSPAFPEDPLRVLRAMQLAARFDLALAPETAALARSIADRYGELARERVREEWFKWAARAVRPSAGLRVLEQTGWLAHFPELAALVGTPQDPAWHPEGDVWTHTGLALDQLVRDPVWREADEPSRIAWSLAVLLHDAGKPSTTSREVRGGAERIVSPGHDVAGGPLAAAFLERIGAPGWTSERVVPLVVNHMTHLQSASERAVRRLARRLDPETISGLAVVIRADAAARPPLPAEPPETLLELLRIADALRLRHEAPRPLLLGRHLIERGWTPGPAVGEVLARAFEAQLDGAFDDEARALRWLDAQPRP